MWVLPYPPLQPPPLYFKYSGLLKLPGVAPTELQELRSGSQPQPGTEPQACWISCVNGSCVFPEAFLAVNLYFYLSVSKVKRIIYFLT